MAQDALGGPGSVPEAVGDQPVGTTLAWRGEAYLLAFLGDFGLGTAVAGSSRAAARDSKAL